MPAGSPCIDAGDGNNAFANDIFGNTRNDDGVDDTGIGTPTYTDIEAVEYPGENISYKNIVFCDKNAGGTDDGFM